MCINIVNHGWVIVKEHGKGFYQSALRIMTIESVPFWLLYNSTIAIKTKEGATV